MDGKKIKLSKTRFIEVVKFKGKILVSIREFYEDNRGKMKHSNKGISLSLQQWTTLLENVEKINKILEFSI